MKSQELIFSVIDAQKAEIEKTPEGLSRELLNDIPVVENFASIITGIRRCGKSTLKVQVLKKQENSGLFLSFDEIQIVDKWELFINQKLKEGYRVFITGSNASLLSRELGTHLTGRHLSTELFPFSCTEFLTFGKLANTVVSFDEYLQTGRMPEYEKKRVGVILQQLMDDILYRDIAVRHNIRNVDALRELTVFLISNIGKPLSARRLTGLFGITATATIIDFFAYLQNSYVVDFVPIFDYSVKTQIRNPKKVYAIDRGIYHQIKTTFTNYHGRQLENAVYLHLRRKYKEIFRDLKAHSTFLK